MGILSAQEVRTSRLTTVRFKHNWMRSLRWLCGFGVLFLFGCSTAEQRQTPPQQAQQPPMTPSVSINAIMVGLVDHSAHVIWNVAETPPKTDDDWYEIEHHAIQLAASGPLIALGGTGQLDHDWVTTPSFRGRAQALTDAAMEALNAVHAKNVDGVNMAGDHIVAACEGCHMEFKPDTPTEGIYHKH